jgi:hypothetical protein
MHRVSLQVRTNFALGLALPFAGHRADAVEPYRRAPATAPDFPHPGDCVATYLMQIKFFEQRYVLLS